MIVLQEQHLGAVRKMEGWNALIHQIEEQRYDRITEELFRSDRGKDAALAVHELLDELLLELKRVASTPDGA